MITPDFKTFEGLAARYPVVPVYREMLADQEQRIGRPQQLYVGAARRDYVPMPDRD